MMKAPILANELPSYAQRIRRRVYLRAPCCRLADMASRRELRMKGRIFCCLCASNEVYLAVLMRWRMLL